MGAVANAVVARSRSSSRLLAALAAASLALGALPGPAAAAGTIPVRVRILKGSRQAPASVDPRLGDLEKQLGKLSYVRWEQVSEQQLDMAFGKSVTVAVPGGGQLELTLVDSRKDTVTFEVRLPASKTVSRLTISKDQRIVHQLTGEKDGVAVFASVRPWP